MSEYRSDVNMWRCADYKTRCTVLDSLKFADQGLRETSQERVAIVNACEYERNSKSFGGIISEVVANRGHSGQGALRGKAPKRDISKTT